MSIETIRAAIERQIETSGAILGAPPRVNVLRLNLALDEAATRLLRAGIHVITTVNIQHLESLYDRVEQVTGVKVKERVPDSVLAEADQIVNVDLPAEDLLERLKAGKVYPPERAERAMENFFTAPNLTRLRELMLTEVAHLIDGRSRREAARGEDASAAERVMVGLSSRSPNAPSLLRKAARLADRLNAPWYAVYIQTPAEGVTRVDAATQRAVGKNLELAQQLGGLPMAFKGERVAGTIAAFAREHGIKVIVMGKSHQSWINRLRHGSVLDALLREVEGIDVMIVDV